MREQGEKGERRLGTREREGVREKGDEERGDRGERR